MQESSLFFTRDDHVWVVILSGGFSSRMTGFKPLLPAGNKEAPSCLERIIALYQSAGVSCLVVAGHRADEVCAVAEGCRALCVVNSAPEEGMFSSLLCGLEALPAQAQAFFVHPVDIPLVRPSTLAIIKKAYQDSDQPWLLPEFQGQEGHPPLLRASLIPLIMDSRGEGGLRGVLSSVPGCAVAVADKNILLDTDTDADYVGMCVRAESVTIPDEEEATALLETLFCVPPKGVAHGKAVANVAGLFSAVYSERRKPLRRNLVTAAALLHDCAKGNPNHEWLGGRLLERLGMPEIAEIVAAHRDCLLQDGADLSEKELVYLADKYVRGSVMVALADRFGEKIQLHSEDASAVEAIQRRCANACRVARLFRTHTGQMPEDVLACAGFFPGSSLL